jgi:putative hydrolase of the HAD superfamily
VNLLAGVRSVFFDAVGTLLFPEPPAAEIYARVAARHGLAISVDEVRARFLHAYREEEQIDRATGWVTSEEREVRRWRRIVGDSLASVRDLEPCFHELFHHFGHPEAWRVNPHAPEVLDQLQVRGLRVGIGSNYDARLLSVVDGIPSLAPLRDRVVISARVGCRKPSPVFFREVIRVAECEPGEILFVGDDVQSDYEGANAVGLRAVLYADRDSAPRVQNRVKSLIELVNSPFPP